MFESIERAKNATSNLGSLVEEGLETRKHWFDGCQGSGWKDEWGCL